MHNNLQVKDTSSKNERVVWYINWNVRTLPGKDRLSKTAKAVNIRHRENTNTTRETITVVGSHPKVYRPHIKH